MKEKFIETENYITMHELLSRLVELEGNAERIGLAYGSYGLGKSFGLERLCIEFDAVLLRTDQTWTVASVLRLLCEELAIDSRGQSSDLMERVVWHLLREPRIVIIDEIDTLLPAKKFEVLELFRDIHDRAHNVLMLVGMESCEARIKNHPHFDSRIIGKVKFKPIGEEDISKFCEQCDIKIEKDLVTYFTKRYPNLRRIKVFLLRIESWAEMNGVASMGLKLFKQTGVEHAEK